MAIQGGATDGVIGLLQGYRTLSAVNGVIRGNRNSKVYHLPEGCPSYDRISERNIVEFQSEAEARVRPSARTSLRHL